MIVMDRHCADLCPSDLSFSVLLNRHRGLRTRVYPVNSIAKLCQKAAVELEKSEYTYLRSIPCCTGRSRGFQRSLLRQV